MTVAIKEYKQYADDNITPVDPKLIDQLLDEFICPITLEVPIDPVFAEDGCIYEREAIEKWIQKSRKKPKKLRSPITNLKMGSKITSLLQIRNVIEKIVKKGRIDNRSRVEQWIEKIRNEERVAELISRAKSGCPESMFRLGRWYRSGKNGLKKDYSKGYSWNQKAADSGHVRAIAMAGMCLIEGCGVEIDVVEGLYYSTLAAEKGSQRGAFNIGYIYESGLGGINCNQNRAKKWLTKVVNGNCDIEDLPLDIVLRAEGILENLYMNER